MAKQFSLFSEAERNKFRSQHGAPKFSVCPVCHTVYRRTTGYKFGCSPACRAESIFWSHVEKTSTCWIWRGWKSNVKYGHYGYMFHPVIKKSVFAHRFSYELHKGSIPSGLVIHHVCENKLCVNPEHLQAVTLVENIFYGNSAPAINRRKTHCNKGHLYDSTNTIVCKGRIGPTRRCRICTEQYNREYSARSSAARKQKRIAKRLANLERAPIGYDPALRPALCRHGHPYTPENTYFSKTGKRECFRCKQLSWEKRRADGNQRTKS